MVTSRYARLDVQIDGVYQLELTDVKCDFDGGLQEVHTIRKPLAGWTEGGGKCSITFASAIPKGGLEFDYMSAVARHEDHTLTVTIGAQEYQSTGVFQTAGVSQAVGASASASAEWQGDLLALT
jgi:hypothetical protein